MTQLHLDTQKEAENDAYVVHPEELNERNEIFIHAGFISVPCELWNNIQELSHIPAHWTGKHRYNTTKLE